MDCARYTITNQDEYGEEEKRADWEMAAGEKDVANDEIVIGGDETFGSSAGETNDDGSPRYTNISDLLGQFRFPLRVVRPTPGKLRRP